MTEPHGPDQDHLLDHNYDGIQEYDNPMPRWWVWVFVVTIVFSVFYGLYYHGLEGRSVHDQYSADMLAFLNKQAEELLAMGPIRESTLLAIQDDAVQMNGAAQVYGSKCVQCHGAAGEGGIGPNLTDDYWLHGGKLTDIYRTVSEGVVEKGMLAWKKTLPLGDVLAVSAYVGTMRGTVPANAKAPQGDVFEYDREAILAAEAEEIAAEEGEEAGEAGAPEGEGEPATEG